MRYWIRHDRPAVPPGICYGHTDLALAVPAQVTADALKPKLPTGLPVYTSPLQRCRQLADLLTNTTPTINPDLREVHFGQWENQLWDLIPRTEIDAWAADPFGYRFPDGESVPEFLTRIESAVTALPDDCVVVTHGGVIRCAHHLIGNQSLPEAFAVKVDFGSITTL